MTKRITIIAFIIIVGRVCVPARPYASYRHQGETLTTVSGIKLTNTMITGWIVGG
jgi:hypothetical protein